MDLFNFSDGSGLDINLKDEKITTPPRTRDKFRRVDTPKQKHYNSDERSTSRNELILLSGRNSVDTPGIRGERYNSFFGRLISRDTSSSEISDLEIDSESPSPLNTPHINQRSPITFVPLGNSGDKKKDQRLYPLETISEKNLSRIFKDCGNVQQKRQFAKKAYNQPNQEAVADLKVMLDKCQRNEAMRTN